MNTFNSFHPKPNYRSDIDGLRALAVLLVLLFHLDVPHVGGGFVGVDVFFIISGYLIGGILFREFDDGTFTFAIFYERRIRRIAPALLAVLLLATPIAYRYFYPPDLKDYGHTLVSSLLSATNFYLLQSDNYFDANNQSRPLMHTWSLSIEEQYYLVFPLLLIAIRRWFPRKRSLILWCLAILSLAAAWAEMRHIRFLYYFSTVFFTSPFRAWELLLGAMIYDLPRAQARWQRESLAALGLLCILITAATYTTATWFPGLGALPPCLGAALVLYAGQTGTSTTGKALSWRPFAFIGLISYSLYLIHWPLIVFQRQSQFLVNESLHPRWVKPSLLGLSLLLASLSWRYIEQPFRSGPRRPARRWLYAATGVPFAVLLAAGLAISYCRGWKIPGIPASPEMARYAAFDLPEPPGPVGPGTCFVHLNRLALYTPSTCLTFVPGQQNYLVFGDSIALSDFQGIRALFPEANVSLASMPGCHPIVTWSPWVLDDCNKLNLIVIKDFMIHHPEEHLLMANVWGPWFEADVGETITYLHAHHVAVTILGQPLEFDRSLPQLIGIAARQHNPAVYNQHFDPTWQEIDRHMATLARTVWHVPYISVYDDLCNDHPAVADPPWQVRTANGCPVFATPTIPIVSDDHHLTIAGSVLFAEAIKWNHQLP